MNDEGRLLVRRAIVRAAARTFADMTFVDVMECSEPRDHAQFDCALRAAFREPEAGEITLYLSSACAALVMENLYCRDPDAIGPPNTQDCTMELLNILVGRFLSEMYGDDLGHAVCIPRMILEESPAPAWNSVDVFLDAEGRSARITVEMKEPEE